MAQKSNLTVYAPLLKSVGKYSNFWGGMGEDYYYQRTESYEKILDRKNIGCHAVPLVHSSMLINLNLVPSQKLTFLPSQISNYDDGPFDDMISFAVSAHRINVSHYICNDNPIYGYVMTPLDGDQDGLSDDLPNLLNLKSMVTTLEEVEGANGRGFRMAPSTRLSQQLYLPFQF